MDGYLNIPYGDLVRKTWQWVVGFFVLPRVLDASLQDATRWVYDLEIYEAVKSGIASVKDWTSDVSVPENINTFFVQLKDDSNAIPTLFQERWQYLKEWIAVADLSGPPPRSLSSICGISA